MTALSPPVEYFRKTAKTLVKQVNQGLASALARVRAVFRDQARNADAEVTAAFGLMRAQHVVAVEHGFAKWEDLIRRSPIELQLAITKAKEQAMTEFGMGRSGDQRRPPKKQGDAVLREQREAPNKRVDVGGKRISPNARRLADPTKQANEVWRSLIGHLKSIGWQVVTRANREAYYTDHAGTHGTLVLNLYDAVVWRWYVDSHDIRKRGKSESIKPQRPVLDGHDLGRTELTCAPEELVELSAWLADWLVAYRGRKPLPALPLPAEGWKRQASDRTVSPWGDNVWTQRARAVYAARYPRPSASAPNALPSGSA